MAAARKDDGMSAAADSSTAMDIEEEVDTTERLLLQLKNGLFGVLVRANWPITSMSTFSRSHLELSVYAHIFAFNSTSCQKTER
jgi:hypothetical protein